MIKKILKIICKIFPFLEPYLFKFIRKNTKRSKGEKLIHKWLKVHNISFKQEYLIKFPFIVKKKPYVFIDFYLPKHNIFIEYNGRQHYEYTPYFHKSEVDFELQKFRDVTVRNYCKNKGITLIEIPYTMTNEEVYDLLKKEIIND